MKLIIAPLHRFSLLCILLTVVQFSWAQNQRQISGRVLDGNTKVGLPFANVILQDQLIGTITNESGDFELLLPDSIQSDTMLVSFVGYFDQKIALQSINNSLEVRLFENAISLDEVTIRPMPPTHYIKMAVQKIAVNYPSTPFESQAYFSEMIQENGQYMAFNEGIFKTFYPNFQDTIPNQNQLQLFRKTDDPQELQFMKEQRDKRDSKAQKRAKKKGEEPPPPSESMISIKDLFGGPERLLKSAKIKSNHHFMDTTRFEDFEYAFNPNSNAAVMIIDVESRKAIDKVKVSGKVFIDIDTEAIIAVEYDGQIKLPLTIKSILLVMGITISNPTFHLRKNYRNIRGLWYPEQIRLNLDFVMTKKKMFSENERSKFAINQIFSVNQIELDNPTSIPEDKRFDREKSYDEQLFNDSGIRWEEVNVVKH